MLGRQTMDTVVKFAPGELTTVRALGTTYDTLGDVVLATSYGWGMLRPSSTRLSGTQNLNQYIYVGSWFLF